MKQVLILLAMMMILWGCAQKPVDEGQFPGTAEYIQNFATDNITPNWFGTKKPVGKIEVTEVQVLSVLASKDEENTAIVTAMLKGEATNPDSETQPKKFNLRKEFKVTKNQHGYSVRLLSTTY